MNETLADLQDRLVRLHKQLRDRLQTTEKADQRQAILTEMVELTHRIQLVGGLLFVAESKDLEAKAGAVAKATKQVRDALAHVQKLKDFLETTSAFLGLVDEAIDLAKTLRS